VWDLKAEHCKAARHLLGWSVTALSQKSGVSKQSIGRFEQGGDVLDVKRNTLRKLLTAFAGANVRFEDGVASSPHVKCRDGTTVSLDDETVCDD
jgi:transcriptional regulator with XRE-family HTH domain